MCLLAASPQSLPINQRYNAKATIQPTNKVPVFHEPTPNKAELVFLSKVYYASSSGQSMSQQGRTKKIENWWIVVPDRGDLLIPFTKWATPCWAATISLIRASQATCLVQGHFECFKLVERRKEIEDHRALLFIFLPRLQRSKISPTNKNSTQWHWLIAHVKVDLMLPISNSLFTL